MASPVQPQFTGTQRPPPRRPEVPGQGVPGGTPAAAGQPPVSAARPPMQVPNGSPPIAPAVTTTPRPPAQNIAAPQTTAPYAAQAQQRAAALQGSAEGSPDRTALAQQAFDQLETNSQPAFEQAQRQVGQSAAKFGRIGAGMTTTALGDVASERERALAAARGQLSTDAAGKTLEDRLALAQNALQQFGTFSGADQSAQRIGLDTELGRGGLDVSRQNANTNATSASNDNSYRTAQLELMKSQGATDEEIRRAQLAETGRQYDTSDQFRRLEADRNFMMDDRLAEALAQLQGYDVNGTNTGIPGQAPVLKTNTGVA